MPFRLHGVGGEELDVVRREGRRGDVGEGIHVRENLGKGTNDGEDEHPGAVRLHLLGHGPLDAFGDAQLAVQLLGALDDNLFWIAVHSGFDANTPEATAKNFDDTWGQGKPFSSPRRYPARGSQGPALAAMHFDDFSTFFFKRVGWDKAVVKATDGSGFFGKALAYTTGIETQGGGTLHFHALAT